MISKEYDVFISFKHTDEYNNTTKDSVIAKKLYEFLTSRGLRVFFSPAELEYLGKAQYSKVIDSALDSSRFLIAVGCSKKNLDSDWVRYEWDSFMNDIRGGLKPNVEVFVLYADMKAGDLPRALRQHQSFDANEHDSFIKLYSFIMNARSEIVEQDMQFSSTHKVSAPTSTIPRIDELDATPTVGSKISFGGDVWRVLDVKDEKALILSEYILEKRAYNEDDIPIKWETSTLRSYLNNEFYDKFDNVEKKRISITLVNNDGNPWCGTGLGESPTNDKVFLLSIGEVVKYFGDSGALESNKLKEAWIDDEYNEARIVKDAEGKSTWWWLRSPGDSDMCASYIYTDGTLYMKGDRVFYAGGGIRPAIWVYLRAN